MKSTKPTARVQPRQKPSAKPTTRTGDRIALPDALRRARRLANNITRRYPMRQWCMWTHHQKHGWWSHVKAGEWAEVKFTQRDLDDLESCWQRCLDESKFDQDILSGLDNVKAQQAALDVAVDELRAIVRRKAKA